ncbi:hypothetical protein QMT40_000592 [Parvibaculaceae bacterium PLY_AMNH_Bact1]|nr:hypothetical protein QMT40_000592 [Parvibaculaceae bacterium PLY_AMNH_Bact1]
MPVLAQIIIWGRHHLPVSVHHIAMAKVMEEGGTKLQRKLMVDLRAMHLPQTA